LPEDVGSAESVNCLKERFDRLSGSRRFCEDLDGVLQHTSRWVKISLQAFFLLRTANDDDEDDDDTTNGPTWMYHNARKRNKKLKRRCKQIGFK